MRCFFFVVPARAVAGSVQLSRQELGGRGFSAARKPFHEDQPRDQALFARSHPGRVDELLGRVVDGAALATWRVQDVEQAWIDLGLHGWR